jgi:hypothetical protein
LDRGARGAGPGFSRSGMLRIAVGLAWAAFPQGGARPADASLDQREGRGLRGKPQVARGLRYDPVAQGKIQEAQGLAGEGQREERKGKEEALREKRHGAAIVVVGHLSVRALVRGRLRAGVVAVEPPVELWARGEDGQSEDERDAERRGEPREG